MRELLIVFQEGFEEANITVTVNGKQTRRDLGVSTNPILGIANEVSVELPADLDTPLFIASHPFQGG